MNPIFQNKNIKIEIEPSEVPWLKIFTIHPYTQMSQAPKQLRDEIYDLLNIIEKEMIEYYQPTKVNIASFGNYMPQLHWHIMARFENDSYFPESMWGKRQREATLSLPSFEVFCQRVVERLADI